MTRSNIRQKLFSSLRTDSRPAPRLAAPILFTLLVAAAALSSCSPAPSHAAAAATSAPPASVATPIVRDIAITQEYPAHVEAIERVELRPQVNGYLSEVTFAEGARVSRGKILFRIDSRPYRAAVKEAEAALSQAVATRDETQRETARAERLADRRAISREEADRRKAAAMVATAQVLAATAALDRAQLNLSFADVRSPITGTIGRAEVTRGNLVSPQTRLATIVATDPVYVRFDVDENTLAAHAGRAWKSWTAEYKSTSHTTPIPAEIAFVENELSAGTGTLRVRARLRNRDGAVIPGMFGTALLRLGSQRSALLIREEAIGADQGQRYVLVAGDDGKLQYRPVELGARYDRLRVIKSGLRGTDRVVVNGLFRLRPGMAVTPQQVAMEKGI